MAGHADSAVVLRGAGLRATRPRLAVPRALRDSLHADVPHLVQAVRSGIGTVSVQAVYAPPQQ